MFHSVRQSRWYTFAMVAIAALLVTGAVLRRPITISTAAATIDETVVPVVGDRLAPDANLPDHSNTQIVSTANIMRVLADDALLRAASTAHGAHADALVAKITDSLTVDISPGPSKGHRQIMIRYRGAAPNGVAADKFAISVVESLAQQYVDAHQGRGENGRITRLESARQRKSAAQQAIDEAQLALRYARDLAEKEAAKKEAANRTASTARRNPAWLDLHSQLLTLTKERDELLQHAEAEHPDLIQYDAHITDLSRRMANTKQWIDLESETTVPANKDAAAQLSDALVMHHRTHGVVRDAEAKLQQARAEFEASSTAESLADSAARQGAMLELHWYVDDATSQHVVKHSPSGSGSMAFMVALMLGGLSAVCIGRPQRCFLSARQIERLLSMPVLTTLAAKDRSSPHVAVPPSLWLARTSRFIAEFVVGVFFVSAILCATSDPAFANGVISEPFGTLAGSVEQSLSTLSR